MSRRAVVVMSCITALALALTGSAAALAQDASTADQKVVLRVGTAADMVTDNPWAACCDGDYEMLFMTYDMLMDFSQKDLTAAPGLATGCESSEEGMTWTCTLRDGLKWSDGQPLTSKDVAFTYRFIIDNNIPQFRSYFPFNPTFETPNDTTFIWHAEAPTLGPSIPPWVYIVPEHVWGQYDGMERAEIKKVSNTPAIGSGPYTLTDWQQGQSWTMEANPNFWGPKPVVDEVVFQVFSSQEAMVQALKNGEIDIANNIIPSLFEALKGTPNVETQLTISDWWLNLAFNFGGQGAKATNLPALHDIRLREAIAHAVDKETLAQVVYQGTATPGDTIIRPASTYWHLDIPPDQEFAFDPELSKQILDDAGYVDTDGDGVREDPKTGDPLQLEILAVEATVGAVDAGRLIDGWLKAVGIDVKLKPTSEARVNELWYTGEWDAYIWYWSGDPDPDYQLGVFTTDQCLNYSDGCFADPKYDQLYLDQQKVLDPAARLKIVQEAQKYLYDQIPGLVLAYPSQLQAYRTDRFTGWVPAPGESGKLIFGYGYFSYVNIRPVEGATAATNPGVPGWIWGVAVGGVLAVVGVILLRRRRDEDA